MHLSERQGPFLHCGRSAVMAMLLAVTGAMHGQELLTSTMPERLMEGSEALQRIALSPDGTAALLLQQGNTFRVVALASGKTLRTFGPLPGKITAMAVEGTTGAALVAIEREVWTVPVDKEVAPKKLWWADGSIQDLSLSPDLDLLAVATITGFQVLNPHTGMTIWSVAGAPCTTIRLAPAGNTMALGVGKTVEIREVPGFTLRQTWSLDFPVASLAYAPDARSLAVSSGNGSILLKRLSDGHTLKQLDADFSGREVTQLTFANDPSGLFAASGRKLQAFSGLDQGAPSSRVLAVKDPILSIAFSKENGALLAVVEGGKALARWPIATAARVSTKIRGDLPSLWILTPETGSKVTASSVEVTFQVVFPPENPVTGIRILAGGRPARITLVTTPGGPSLTSEGSLGGTFQSGRSNTCQVQLPDQDTTLLLLADSAQGSSEPAILKLHRDSEPLLKAEQKVVPPTLTLVSPAGKALLQSASIPIAFRVNAAAGQPVTLVRAMIDGVPVVLSQVTRADGTPFDASQGWVNGETYHCPIPVPEWDSTLTLIADSAYASSVPAVSKLHWKPHARTSSPVTSVSSTGDATVPEGVVGTDAGKVKANADQTSRILDGGPQGTPLAMEVDAKGHLRWRDPADGPPKKTAAHGSASTPARPATKAKQLNLPTAQIVAPADGSRFKSREVQLSVKVGSGHGQDITKLQVFVDGTLAEAIPQSPTGAALNPPYAGAQVLKIKLPVPPQDCQVSVLAENANGQGKPSVLRLKFEGEVAATSRSVISMAKPRIAIIEPQHNSLVRSNIVQIGVRVGLDPRQPPPAIRILVDAQEVKADKVTPPAAAPGAPPAPTNRGATEDMLYYNVTLPSKDCTVMAYAETPYATSDPSLIKLRWESPAKAASAATGLPTLYLLSVGVSHYKDKNILLTYPSKDAKDFAEVMSQQKGKLYKDVVERVLTDAQATRDNIMDDLEWIQRQATQRDMVIVFMAGHGMNDAVTGNYYYLPYDANIEAVKRTMIPGSEIHSTLARLTGTRLLFMDTCHAGNVTGTATRGVPDLRQFLQDLKDGGQGLVVITSSRPGQMSQEHPSWNNGAFTKALVEGLKGKAQKDRQGLITFTALDAYITQRVKELTKGTQAPASQKSTEVSDFPLAVADL
jgi:WD40 repeat protein